MIFLNLKDCLNNAEDAQIKAISRALGIDPDNAMGIEWLKKDIVRYLLDWRRLELYVIRQIPYEKNYRPLHQIAFGGHTDNPGLLSKFGLLYNNAMPDDLQLLVRDNLRSIVLKNLKNEPDSYLHSTFLKLVLLLNHFHHQEKSLKNTKNNRYKIFDMLKIEHSIGEKIITYLYDKSLLIGKEFLCLNDISYKQWHETPQLERHRDFYQSILPSSRLKNYWIFFRELAEAQGDNFEFWIPSYVFLDSSLGAQKALTSLGLLRIKEDNGNHYIQLTPEGWYLMAQKYPTYWQNKQLILSADFEIFVPSDFDPFIIEIIMNNSTLRDIDFLLIFDFPTDETNLIKKFRQILLDNAVHIPDIVRYELENNITTI